ncbi:MAG: hypothetical protein DYH08_05055 [Actinobacteria bacterium ATB1]|nr:hypothetical protein [Actinobacteria bacterium ATB1]
MEVCRPNRQRRRRQGESDPTDAADVEAIRVLAVAKRSARSQRRAALTRMHLLIIAGPTSSGAVSEAWPSERSSRPGPGSEPR